MHSAGIEGTVTRPLPDQLPTGDLKLCGLTFARRTITVTFQL